MYPNAKETKENFELDIYSRETPLWSLDCDYKGFLSREQAAKLFQIEMSEKN